MVFRNAGTEWFVKNLGGGATSRRLILPGKDSCRVKATAFSAPAGWNSGNFDNLTDETVLVLSGACYVGLAGEEGRRMTAGAVWHAAAGEVYSVMVVDDVELFCVFSPSGEQLPDDE